MTPADTSSVQDLLSRAAALYRAGRTEKAIGAYEELLAVEAALPDSWYNLAMLYRDARRFEEALAAYEQALAHAVQRPEEVHLQRAVILSDDLRNSAAARAELLLALEIAPDYSAALLNLGNLHEDNAEWVAAIDAYRRVLTIDPDNALALSRLLGLVPIAGSRDPLIVRAEAGMRRYRASPLDRADLGFAVGAALDRLGAFDRAFAAYRDANRATAGVSPRYDPEAEDVRIDRLIAAFRAVAETPLPVAASAPPLFIVGMFRSGSTLAERMLARHSRVIAGGELDTLPALIASYVRPYPEAMEGIGPERLSALRDAYLREVDALRPAGTMLIDKRPDNVAYVGIIKRLFPDARIVHTVRDPIDTCLSVWFLHADPSLAYATNLATVAHHLKTQERLMEHWRTLWPNDIHTLDYDRLVGAPRAEIERLLTFCGLEWEEAVLDHREPGDAVRTASHRQVNEPLYTTSSGRWRNYAHHLDPALLGLRRPGGTA